MNYTKIYYRKMFKYETLIDIYVVFIIIIIKIYLHIIINIDSPIFYIWIEKHQTNAVVPKYDNFI